MYDMRCPLESGRLSQFRFEHSRTNASYRLLNERLRFFAVRLPEGRLGRNAWQALQTRRADPIFCLSTFQLSKENVVPRPAMLSACCAAVSVCAQSSARSAVTISGHVAVSSAESRPESQTPYPVSSSLALWQGAPLECPSNDSSGM